MDVVVNADALAALVEDYREEIKTMAEEWFGPSGQAPEIIAAAEARIAALNERPVTRRGASGPRHARTTSAVGAPVAASTVLPALTAETFGADHPDVTPLPITGGEDGQHYGFGHIDAETFANAATDIDIQTGVLSDLLPDDERYDPAQVVHRWAVTTFCDSGEWSADWAEQGTSQAWPITVLEVF